LLREKVVEKDNQSTNMGKLVETLLLEPEEFDNRFYMSSTVSIPSGLMGEFVEALYRVTVECTDDDGIITRDFEEITEEAYIASGFKIKKEQVLNKFAGSDAEIYYKEIREVRSKDLIVITTQDITNAEKIVDELRNNEFTSPIINQESDDRFTVFNQFKIDGYTVDDHEFKSMLDKVIIDHETKTVHIYDLKCVWSVEGFYNDYYLYRRSYIQAYLYHKAMTWLSKQESSPFYEYEIGYLKFIVCDSINYYSPLIYTVDSFDMINAYVGFEHSGKQYPGVRELIKDLKWAFENDTWTISRTNYNNNGHVSLRS